MAYRLQLYAAAQVPANNMQSVLIPKTGRILTVDWTIIVAASGADYTLFAELAFTPTLLLNVNGADGVISTCANAGDLTTSGCFVSMSNFNDILGAGINVSQGARVYLNATGTAINCTYVIGIMFDYSLGR